MSRSKDIGTRRETWFVRKAEEAGLKARRAPNNSASKDVIVTAGGVELPHEVKDVASLSLHPLLAKVTEINGPDAAVVWHRKKKVGDGRLPAGPTLVAITVDRYLELLKAAYE